MQSRKHSNSPVITKEFLSPSDLIEMGIVGNIQTLKRWRMLSQGPRWYKCGHNVRYRRSDLDAWLSERISQPTAA